MFPRGQVESLKQTLRTLVAQQLISKSKISREKNVSPESLEKIIQSLEHDDDLGGLSSVQGHLASNSYRLVLSEAIRNLLDKAVKEARCVPHQNITS